MIVAAMTVTCTPAGAFAERVAHGGKEPARWDTRPVQCICDRSGQPGRSQDDHHRHRRHRGQRSQADSILDKFSAIEANSEARSSRFSVNTGSRVNVPTASCQCAPSQRFSVNTGNHVDFPIQAFLT